MIQRMATYGVNKKAIAHVKKLIEGHQYVLDSGETKARHAFVAGDFRRVHRSALIACVYRASEWRHKEVELAAHDLLQLLDSESG